jgi:type IV pilus assembly protein PilA
MRQAGFTLIELMMVIGIIGILCGIAVPIYVEYVFRARLTEAHVAAGMLRLSLVEQLAMSGDPVEVPMSGDAISSISFETHLGGQGAVDRPKTQTAAKGEKRTQDATKEGASVGSRLASYGSAQDVAARGDQTGTSKYVSSAQLVGNAVRVAGNIGKDYEIWLYPAVTDEATPSVYRWLCGGVIPDGWIAQSRTSRNSLPNRLLNYDCRARKAQ